MSDISNVAALLGSEFASNRDFTDAVTAVKQATIRKSAKTRYTAIASADVSEVLFDFWPADVAPNGIKVLSVTFLTSAAVTASDSAYYTWLLQSYAGGATLASGNTVVLSKTTKITGGLNGTAINTPTAVTVTANAVVAAGGFLTFTSTKTSSATATDLWVSITYEIL